MRLLQKVSGHKTYELNTGVIVIVIGQRLVVRG